MRIEAFIFLFIVPILLVGCGHGQHTESSEPSLDNYKAIGGIVANVKYVGDGDHLLEITFTDGRIFYPELDARERFTIKLGEFNLFFIDNCGDIMYMMRGEEAKSYILTTPHREEVGYELAGERR